MKNDPGKKVFEMLAFQYKPLEKRVLEDFRQAGRHDLIKVYKSWSYAKRIHALDMYAHNVLGL
jgi:hypothetical protein